MKLQTPSRHSSRGPALPPSGPLLSSAVRGSRAAGRESRSLHHGPLFTDHASQIANHYSPVSPFLVGCTAIRNGRNPSAIITKSISNRSKIERLRARFSHVLHSANQPTHRTAHAFLIASRQLLEIHLTCSQQTRKFFLIASFSGSLAHPWPLAARRSHLTARPRTAAHQSLITAHKSRVTNRESRYNHAFQRAAGQSNQRLRSAAGHRHPAPHETGFGLRSSNIAALVLRTAKDNA
jgi:hypothetical protein